MAKGSGGWGKPGGGGGGANAGKAQDMQAKLMEGLMKAQEDLASATVEAVAGGGAIKVVMKGDQHVQSITLAPEIVDPEDVEMLQDLLIVAINEALEKVQGLQSQLMGSLTGGMKIPGLT
ncbi:MAG: YbaB/EbfC family nucleoid-associated protein [Dehalococcoidia bacterium]